MKNKVKARVKNLYANAAKELLYPQDVVDKIHSANTFDEISDILMNARLKSIDNDMISMTQRRSVIKNKKEP